LKLQMETQFPFANTVTLRFALAAPAKSKIRVRVPSWSAHAMPIEVNGKVIGSGKAGTYLAIERVWKNGDRIAFDLPAALRVTQYEGAEQNDAQPRYAFQYGPILMAAVGVSDSGAVVERPEARFALSAGELSARLQPQAAKPLHFAIEGEPDYQFIPYWEVKLDQTFTCFPIVGARVLPPEKVAADDLSLSSKGATASSDSEYENEAGGTKKAIDGIIATNEDFTNRWHSSLQTPHPHWIEVHLPKAAALGKIIIHFADPQGHPSHFQGVARVAGRDQIVFEEKDYRGRARYEADLKGIQTDTFRLIILDSANPAYPNAAQISEIELLATR